MKFKADQLFDGYRFRDPGEVLIVSVEGVVEDIVPENEAGDNIITVPGILSPGFINCHCHLELSHMKGAIPEKTGLVEFVTRVVLDRHYSQDVIDTAIEKAETEMWENGIVAVGDICNNTHTIPQKTKGRIWYHNFIEASGFAPAVVNARFERAVGLFREYAKNYGIPVASNSIVPHAPYSVAPGLWDKIIHFPGNQLLTIHNQESIAEEELFRNGTGDFFALYKTLNIDASAFIAPGTSSLQHYLTRFLPNQPAILVHNVHTHADDLAFARSHTRVEDLFWCLCPNANLYISGQLPDITLLADSDCQIVLGTDSLASNHQLSILSEMQTIQQHFPLLSLARLFSWATLSGAKALQLDQLLGSFEKGKQPGVVVCDPALGGARRLV